MPDEPLHSPHDAFFKEIFGRPENAAGLLRSQLHPDLAAALDWDSLALAPGSFVDATLRPSHSDLLYTIRPTPSAADGTGDGPAAPRQWLLHLLFEHQTASDPLMAFRLLGYIHAVWRQWLKENPQEETLPPVIPIVLHQGAGPWRAPLRLSQLVRTPPSLRETLLESTPDFSYTVTDLSGLPVAGLRLGLAAQAALLAMQMVVDREPLARLDACLRLLAQLLQTSDATGIVRAVLLYLAKAHGRVTASHVRQAIAQIPEPMLDEKFMTIYEECIQKGEARGLLKGEARGLVKGAADVAIRQITRRLGPPGPAQEKKIRALELPQLERLAEDLLDFTTPDDLETWLLRHT